MEEPQMEPLFDDEPELVYDVETDISAFGQSMPSVATPGGGTGGRAVMREQTPAQAKALKMNSEREDEQFIQLEEDLVPVDAAGAIASAVTPARTPRGGGGGDAPGSSAASKRSAPGTPHTPAGGGEEGELGNKVIPPWISSTAWQRTLAIRSPLLRLHQEMVDFMRYVQPAPEEVAARNAAVERVRDTALSIWPSASLEVFGSYATGLYLPTSDIDAVLLHSKLAAHLKDPGAIKAEQVKGLRALAAALTRRDQATDVQVVGRARVPIVKFTEKESGFQFDISFDVANGPAAAAWVNEQQASLVALKPIALVLKLFLQQRELNEVYTGGLGSYALLTVIIAHLFMHPSRFASPDAKLEDNLGVLLLDFFEMYGRKLNVAEVGVSVQDGGGFFLKEEHGMLTAERPWLFTVMDPNDATNDIGRNSWNARKVRVAFDHAYQQLVAAEEPDDDGGSLLERLIRLDPSLYNRCCPTPPPVLELPQDSPAVPASSSREHSERGKKKRARTSSPARSDSPSQHQGGGGGAGSSGKKESGGWLASKRRRQDGDERGAAAGGRGRQQGGGPGWGHGGQRHEASGNGGSSDDLRVFSVTRGVGGSRHVKFRERD